MAETIRSGDTGEAGRNTLYRKAPPNCAYGKRGTDACPQLPYALTVFVIRSHSNGWATLGARDYSKC
jgi:hypothetical protein